MFYSKDKKGDEKIIGIIGKGVSLSGKLNFQGTVRIDGEFEGEIDGDGTLIVGEEANIKTEAKVGSILIRGNVSGSIEAQTKIDIQSPGKVFGDIKTSKLVIGEGAIFKGSCMMGERSENPPVELKSYMEAKKAEV